ncbi:MAG: type VI secretion system tube protein Hcp [Pseudomonadota bacterium]
MAIDAFLQIDGIKGESADSSHQTWIELTSAHWGVAQPASTTAATAGGHTAGRCEHRTLSFYKLTDLASPVLMQTCSMGKTIPKSKLEFMRADGDGKPVKYYEIELENIMIASMEQVISEGSILCDSIGLKFSKVKWKYTQQKIGGGTCGSCCLGLDRQQVRLKEWLKWPTTHYGRPKIRVAFSCFPRHQWTRAITSMGTSTIERRKARTSTHIRS